MDSTITFKSLQEPWIHSTYRELYNKHGKPLPKLMGVPKMNIYEVDKEKYLNFMKKSATVVMDLAWKERDNISYRALGYKEDINEQMMFRHTTPADVYHLMEYLIVGDWTTNLDGCKFNFKKIEPLIKKYEDFFPGLPVSMIKYQHGEVHKAERDTWFFEENVTTFWNSFFFSGSPWNEFRNWLEDEISKRAGDTTIEYKRTISIDGSITSDDTILLKVTTQKVEKDAPWAKCGLRITASYYYELVDDMDEYDSVPPAHLKYIINAFAKENVEVKGVRLYSMDED